MHQCIDKLLLADLRLAEVPNYFVFLGAYGPLG